MAQVEWAILCDYAFFAEPRKISIIGAFDIVRVPGVPGALSALWLGIRLVGDPHEKVTFRVEFALPDGLAIAGEGFQRSAELSDSGTADAIIQINNFPVKGYGKHIISVLVPGHEPKVVTLNVVQSAEAEKQGTRLQEP